jgi:septal ring factor EnvC (AmiA/AmiB activator)
MSTLALLAIAWRHRAWLGAVSLGLACLATAGLWRWERHDRLAAEAQVQALAARLDLAEGDVQRWRDAVTVRDRALAEQQAALERLRSDAARADAVAQRARDETSAARAAAERRIQALEEEAHAKPEDVRALGPLVLRRAGGLFD